jgi:spermidine synthase/MFS family permease
MGWLRMLRLVFGSSTNATAAVLAIFMGGLGLGGYLLGRRGERTENPLDFYARLELGISLAAAVSPILIAAIRALYIAVGGTQTLGLVGGTGLRLLLAGLVLGLPTFLMGGTLPAAVRSITREADRGRHSVGWLYAVNTLGAVTGAIVTTFVLIELVGIQNTIWLAALLNLLIALGARSTAREQGSVEPLTAGAIEPGAREEQTNDRRSRVLPVLIAAGVVGFVFFLMELVWYRMLSPILGGSTYTFGVILIVALFGIGAGGLLYALLRDIRQPTLRHFSMTCILEALCIAVPLALGDLVALFALQMRGLQAGGFTFLALGWTAVSLVVVLPASLVAGYQFPLLVALLGTGRKGVSRQVGLAYAWNTAGAILGSIAGGFGLIPLMSAPTVWRMCIWVLLGLGLWFLLKDRKAETARGRRALIGAMGVAALLLSLATGPTAFWRHGSIGAGRMTVTPKSSNDLRDIQNFHRRLVEWEADGRESSVALVNAEGYAFYINGKSDGSARGDAATQVMSGLVGAALHPEPRTSLVIGLGTGSSAGWLADLPTMERVDVVELEPVIEDVARACAPVNRGVMDRDDVEVIIADGREFLLTADQTYDVIFSEPSNPYRVGISSLFTREFYQAASRALSKNGVFVQWLQAYEVDAQVVRTAYATLGSVFPYVETWQVHQRDLLLVATKEPLQHDVAAIRARLSHQPLASALSNTWGVSGVEGFYAGFVASHLFAKAVAKQEGDQINTDDRPIIEFGFARHLGRKGSFNIEQLRWLARMRGEDLPPTINGAVNWKRVEDIREARLVYVEAQIPMIQNEDPGRTSRSAARSAYSQGMLAAAGNRWSDQEERPQTRADLLLVGESLAELGDDGVPEIIESSQTLRATEREAILARWFHRQGEPTEATDHLISAFTSYRTDPWPFGPLMIRALELSQEIARAHPDSGYRLYEALAEPFTLQLYDEKRAFARIELARVVDFPGLCVPSFEAFEPFSPWTEPFLRQRLMCYAQSGHHLAARADRQLDDFNAKGESQIWWGLLPETEVQVPVLEPSTAPATGRRDQ